MHDAGAAGGDFDDAAFDVGLAIGDGRIGRNDGLGCGGFAFLGVLATRRGGVQAVRLSTSGAASSSRSAFDGRLRTGLGV
ncbi:hypothetical protein EM6_0140 [Asticcacaulis excentricus]|uniref:Uncharacterized protein n=1 Tax=Asticcacaulis excentricus TaxID=78587 RepID=A0A3G9FWS7_9CAUL|nr:hypothetical protein EM6_0140 [Asticcacaulis excentricus]